MLVRPSSGRRSQVRHSASPKAAPGVIGGVTGAYARAARVRRLVRDVDVPRSYVRDDARDGAPPGPGQYDATAAFHAAKIDKAALDHSSSMFSAGLDRWGAATKPGRGPEPFATPGPGWYDVDVPSTLDERARTTALSSAFVSQTKRVMAGARSTKVPGPAQYAPEQLGRKSFLLNASSRWV